MISSRWWLPDYREPVLLYPCACKCHCAQHVETEGDVCAVCYFGEHYHETMLRGHHISNLRSSDEGTSYCVVCEEEEDGK